MELSGNLSYIGWQAQVRTDLELLDSLSHIQKGHKYEWNSENHQFNDYQLAKFVPEILRKLGESRYRGRHNLTVQNTVEGIVYIKTELVKILTDAEKLIQTNPAQVEEIKKTVRIIRDSLGNAIKGLYTLESTYERTPTKKLELIGAVNTLESEVKTKIKELLGDEAKAPSDILSEFYIMDPIEVPQNPLKAPPLPFLRPKSKQQLEFNEYSKEDFDEMLEFLGKNREQILKEMKEGKEEVRRYKNNNTELPWTILVTKNGDIFFHYGVPIVAKDKPGETEGAFKKDKRGYHYEIGEDIAKLTTKIAGNEIEKAKKLTTAENEEKFLPSVSELPNVVKTYAIFWEEINGVRMQRIYQKYYSHGDLNQSLDRIKDDPVKIRQILLGVITGLAALHEKGIVHRDLKAANVFLDENDTPHLGDFGLACMAGEKKVVGGILLAEPRILELRKTNGQSIVDTQSDLWLLGMLMYRLLCKDPTNRCPWPWLAQARNIDEVIYGHQFEKPRLFPEPDKNDVWLHACWELLQLDPNQRPSAQALVKHLTPAATAAI